jgi:PadR family transcriptional regulator, regulatory protein AphA
MRPGEQAERTRATMTPAPREPRLGPAEYSLLGLLAVAGTEGVHGYDLQRHYTHGALGEIIRLEPGMLYHHLKKLDRYGLVTTEVIPQPDRPDRRTHTLTDAGREQLERWLRAPVRATREIRLDFLLKLFFARRLDPAHRASLIAQQHRVLSELEASLRAQMDAPGTAESDDRAPVLHLRQLQTRAALEWLDGLEHEA